MKDNKKSLKLTTLGFTLVELLAVIVILAVILAIAIPNVINISKQQAYDRQKELIRDAARKYIVQNLDNITWNGNIIEITLGTLQNAKLIDNPLSNPKGGNFDSMETKVVVTKNGESYTYETIVPGDIQSFTAFKLTYGGTLNDSYRSIINVVNGYIIVGQSPSNNGDLIGLNKGSADGIVVKYYKNSNIAWKKNFGGSLGDYFNQVIGVLDGFVVVGGSLSTDGDLTGLINRGQYDAILVKYDLNGNIVWKKNFGGTLNDSYQSIINIVDGYVAVGYSSSGNGDLLGLNRGSEDAIIVKYDLNGNVVWKKNYGGSNVDYFLKAIPDASGYIAVGYSLSTDNDLTSLNKGGYDGIIVKYDLNGNVIWKKNYGGSNNDYFLGVTSTTDGYVLSGHSESTNGDLTGLNKGSLDAIIVKYDLNGNVVWKKNYGGSVTDYSMGIANYGDSFILYGQTDSSDGDISGLYKGNRDIIAVNYDSNGNVMWKKNYGGNSADFCYDIVSFDDKYIIVGESLSTDGDLTGLNKGSYDAIIFAIDPSQP